MGWLSVRGEVSSAAMWRLSSFIFTDREGQSGETRVREMPEKNKDQRHKEGPFWVPPGPQALIIISERVLKPLDPVQHSNIFPIPAFLFKSVQAHFCC